MAKIETFQKLKGRFDREALLKSLLFGLSFGLFVTGLLLLIFKLCRVRLALPYYILIGAGSAAAAVGVLFFAFRRSDKAFARSLDERLALPEKIQTMVEFRERSGDIVEMQRADAEEILRNAPKGKSFFRRFWAVMLAVALSAATFVSALLVPARTRKPTNVIIDPPFAVSEWQIRALTELISGVRGSQMQEEAKTPSLTALEDLLTILPNVTLQKDMKRLVVTAIVTVDEAVENVNSYKALCVALYRDSKSEGLKAFAKNVAELSGGGYEGKFEKLQANYFADENVCKEIERFRSETADKLANVQVAETDPLRVAIQAFASELSQTGERLEGGEYDEEGVQALLTPVFKSGAEGVGSALLQQYDNKAVRDHVKTRLMEIFGLEASDLPSLAGDVEPKLSGEENKGNGEEQGGGGYGEGDNLYAGDDAIYDPYGAGGGGYKPYGDAWEETYYAKMSALIEEGGLDPELVKFINDYILKLSPSADGKSGN